jgi:hypothetical protein
LISRGLADEPVAEIVQCGEPFQEKSRNLPAGNRLEVLSALSMAVI